MTNPFDAPEGRFNVLVNEENQHSLWPAFLDAPAGWRITFGPAGKESCLEHVESAWTDMRPASLVAATSHGKQASGDGKVGKKRPNYR